MRSTFWLVTLVLVTSKVEGRIVALAPTFPPVQFPSYRNRQDSNPERFSVFWYLFLQPPRRKKQLSCWRRSSIVLSFRAAENIFAVNRIWNSFRHCDFCFCNLLFETVNCDFSAVFILCLVSELQEPSPSGIELRTIFWSSGHPLFFKE
jgi:hypothetical protein